MGTTLAALQTGSARAKWVVAIEGYKYLLTDATPAAAVTAHAGHSGGDWTQALGGLFVELENSQRIDPYDPFTPGGRCNLSILDVDGTDRFGIDVYRRSAGAETVLTGTIDRNDVQILVANNVGFAAATDELHIGTECLEYYSTLGTQSFDIGIRGKYSPFGSGGTGGSRFGNHHRVAFDKNHVLLNPIVSQQPRIWLGRRVGVWMHTVGADGALNSYEDALCAYAGIIVGVSDDQNSMCTKLELKHMLDVVQDSTVGSDIFGGEVADGLFLVAGRQFTFKDFKDGAGERTANALEVVASGAAGANQINEGVYMVDGLAAILSNWLGSELAAGRVWGHYSWASPISTSVGLRTRCAWTIESASYVPVQWEMYMPGEVAAFLGMKEAEGSERGQSLSVADDGYANHSPHYSRDGDAVPFASLVFKPAGPGGGQEFSEALIYPIENQHGVFVDQFDNLPAVLKAAASTVGHQWGIFLLDEKTLIVAAYDTGANRITNAWLAPWRKPGDDSTESLTYIGRRLDEGEAGPVKIRQVYVLTGTLKTIVTRLFYGSGTNGYNHATLDTLGPGLGVAIPGSLLGAAFDQSVANLPGAQAEMAVIFDESTTLPDLIASDLLLRRTSLRWKNEGFDLVQWQTPSGLLSVATLSDANKAAPAGNDENHRAPTLETTVFQRAIVKIDYCRDFSVGRNGDYLKSIQLEDQVAVDDAGGETRPLTIKARNTYSDFAGTGAAIEELTKTYLATMPQFSRSARHIRRSIGMPHWETIGVGDIVTTEDTWARDPATGLRGINSRYGTVISITYDPGGPTPGSDSIRDMTGEVEIRLPDVNRHLTYGPSARVDETAGTGGYNAGTKTLTCHAHKYSEASEAADASHFPALSAVTIVEVDPDDPAVVDTWDDIVASQTGNTITLTTGLAGWDATKRYIVTNDSYGDGTTAQHDTTYQADTDDQMVEDIEVAYQYSSTDETIATTANTGTDKVVFHSGELFGDGRSLAAGSDAELANLINMLIDRKTAHQLPFLGDITSTGFGGWTSVLCGPVYLGQDQLGQSVARSLTIALWMRQSGVGPNGDVRASLSRICPQSPPFAAPFTAIFVGARFDQWTSQTTAWTPTGTTWEMSSDKTLSIAVKDLTSGMAWLTIEVTNGAQVRGLAKCIEGVRTLI